MNIPKISDAEWEVMKLIWKSSPLTSEEMVDSLSGKMNCSPSTIKTYINRLLKKGALGYEKDGRSYVYYAKVSEKDCILAESKNFIEKVYDGATAMFFANFIEEKALTDEEIQQLRELLKDKKPK
ncbi:MAG: BlaI/MecI/CopY family transcriptional regulator [Syntrophomonadaceae bacterium]|nr:BlaI/MecI/CopY family transcriptional regulator [Syntrophomonadaceae bacterium]